MTENPNNNTDKFGKTVGDLTAVWMTLNNEAQEKYVERIDHHTERMVMHLGFPTTGYDMCQAVIAISQIAVAALLLDEYLAVTEKGFATFEDSKGD